MKKRLLGAVAAAAVMIGPAVAADLRRPVTKAPPVYGVYNWTGFYAGGHCGSAWARTTTSNNAPFDGFDNSDPVSYSLSDSGWTCGGQLGFNWQVGAWVIGVEGDIGWLDIDRAKFFSPTPVGGADADFVSVSYSWYATATARIGYAWDRVLLYAKGGAAWARIENAAADANTSLNIDAGDFRSDSKTRTGWAVGGGLEYGITPNVSLKVEYLYLDFGDYTSGLNADGDTFNHDNRVHTLKAGFNIRFGGPVHAKY